MNEVGMMLPIAAPTGGVAQATAGAEETFGRVLASMLGTEAMVDPRSIGPVLGWLTPSTIPIADDTSGGSPTVPGVPTTSDDDITELPNRTLPTVHGGSPITATLGQKTQVDPDQTPSPGEPDTTDTPLIAVPTTDTPGHVADAGDPAAHLVGHDLPPVRDDGDDGSDLPTDVGVAVAVAGLEAPAIEANAQSELADAGNTTDSQRLDGPKVESRPAPDAGDAPAAVRPSATDTQAPPSDDRPQRARAIEQRVTAQPEARHRISPAHDGNDPGSPRPAAATADGPRVDAVPHITPAHVDGAQPAGPQPSIGTRQPHALSAAVVDRVEQALRHLEQAPPPRVMTVHVEELNDLRITVALRPDGVHVSTPDRSSASQTLIGDIRSALSAGGFDLSGEGRERHRRPSEEPQTAWTPPPVRNRARRADDDSIRM